MLKDYCNFAFKNTGRHIQNICKVQQTPCVIVISFSQPTLVYCQGEYSRPDALDNPSEYVSDGSHTPPAQFSVGSVLRHKRHGYRCVVVEWHQRPAVDIDDALYLSQGKEQPFYNVSAVRIPSFPFFNMSTFVFSSPKRCCLMKMMCWNCLPLAV